MGNPCTCVVHPRHDVATNPGLPWFMNKVNFNLNCKPWTLKAGQLGRWTRIEIHVSSYLSLVRYLRANEDRQGGN